MVMLKQRLKKWQQILISLCSKNSTTDADDG